jgi:hypothetical protein
LQDTLSICLGYVLCFVHRPNVMQHVLHVRAPEEAISERFRSVRDASSIMTARSLTFLPSLFVNREQADKDCLKPWLAVCLPRRRKKEEGKKKLARIHAVNFRLESRNVTERTPGRHVRNHRSVKSLADARNNNLCRSKRASPSPGICRSGNPKGIPREKDKHDTNRTANSHQRGRTEVFAVPSIPAIPYGEQASTQAKRKETSKVRRKSQKFAACRLGLGDASGQHGGETPKKGKRYSLARHAGNTSRCFVKLMDVNTTRVRACAHTRTHSLGKDAQLTSLKERHSAKMQKRYRT